MPDETVASNRNQFADEAVRLDFSPVANRHILLDLHKRSDKAAVADRAPVQVCRLHNLDRLAKRDIADAALEQDRIVIAHCALRACSVSA